MASGSGYYSQTGWNPLPNRMPEPLFKAMAGVGGTTTGGGGAMEVHTEEREEEEADHSSDEDFSPRNLVIDTLDTDMESIACKC